MRTLHCMCNLNLEIVVGIAPSSGDCEIVTLFCFQGHTQHQLSQLSFEHSYDKYLDAIEEVL